MANATSLVAMCGLEDPRFRAVALHIMENTYRPPRHRRRSVQTHDTCKGAVSMLFARIDIVMLDKCHSLHKLPTLFLIMLDLTRLEAQLRLGCASFGGF